MPGQTLIKYFWYLLCCSLFYIVIDIVVEQLKTQAQCGAITHCVDMVANLNAIQPFFLLIAVIIGTLWLIVKGINASEREVMR
jgi:nucleoside recognition membrane protein YjiH|tara:strand:+ start:2379 stop:2627 length:249 start_codon:yes stop_codon:yes gene_type:complete